ncbi:MULTISPECIES: transposase [Streptomyces]|uniref:Transposase n=1 Tax=Streptomyces flaveolus TaxID=67297 RepID=A0ABV1VFS8_9ACTN
MGSKYTKRYTEEFKRDAIALVDSSGRTVTAVTRELGISSESLRGWFDLTAKPHRTSPMRLRRLTDPRRDLPAQPLPRELRDRLLAQPPARLRDRRLRAFPLRVDLKARLPRSPGQQADAPAIDADHLLTWTARTCL